MSQNSVSRIKIILEIQGKSKFNCKLKRHLSPHTVGTIFRSLPIEGNAHLVGNSFAYLETPIESGLERPRKEFKEGDIAFLPKNGGICFFLKNAEPGTTMTPIGNITSEIDLLKKIKPGDVFLLYSDTD